MKKMSCFSLCEKKLAWQILEESDIDPLPNWALTPHPPFLVYGPFEFGGHLFVLGIASHTELALTCI